MNNYNEKAEQNLLEMQRKKEESDTNMLKLEIIIGYMSSIMLDLCQELKISVNELFSGERLEMNNYNEKAEQNLLEMQRKKEESDTNMLKLEIIIVKCKNSST